MFQARDRDGNLGEVPHSRSGSYLVFALEEGATAFYVAEAKENGDWMIWIGIAAGVLVLAAAIAIFRGRKRKKSE